jgi:hypothetical protein
MRASVSVPPQSSTSNPTATAGSTTSQAASALAGFSDLLAKGATLPEVQCQSLIAILEDAMDQLAVLGNIAPEVVRHSGPGGSGGRGEADHGGVVRIPSIRLSGFDESIAFEAATYGRGLAGVCFPL